MNDVEFAAQMTRLRKLADKWVKPIGLGWWRVEAEYERDSGNYHVDGEPSPNGVANIKADWRYMHATITFNMLRVAEQDDEHLEWIYVHELMHIFLNETRDLKGDGQLTTVRDDWLNHEERIASTLAHAFIWIRNDAIEKTETRLALAGGC